MNLKGTHVCLAPPPSKSRGTLQLPPPFRDSRPLCTTQAPWSGFANSRFPPPPSATFSSTPHFGPGDWRGKCGQRRKFGRRRVGLRSEQASGWVAGRVHGAEPRGGERRAGAGAVALVSPAPLGRFTWRPQPQ